MKTYEVDDAPLQLLVEPSLRKSFEVEAKAVHDWGYESQLVALLQGCTDYERWKAAKQRYSITYCNR